MCAPSPPPQPDYGAAATAQGTANKETAIVSSQLNNPNVVNPYGTQTWVENTGTPVFDQAAYDKAMQAYQQSQQSTTDGGSGGLLGRLPWNQTTTGATAGGTMPNRADFYTSGGDIGRPTLIQEFSPEQQALYEQSLQTKGLLGGLGTQGATALQGIIGRGLDLTGAPAVPRDSQATRQNVIDAMMSRVNEDYGRTTDKANSELIAAGIRPGTKAYDDRMALIERGRNDARQQAILAGGAEAQRDFGMDTQARKDYIAEILASRGVPLNEITALMSGSQVSNPFAVPGAAQNTNIAPPPIFGAANQAAQYGTDVYNAGAASSGNTMSGLFSLGAAALPLMFSDRRLKSNIKRIGTHRLGIGIYEYDIFGRRETGVMAQELLHVKPSAVHHHSSGYMMVDYGAI